MFSGTVYPLSHRCAMPFEGTTIFKIHQHTRVVKSKSFDVHEDACRIGNDSGYLGPVKC